MTKDLEDMLWKLNEECGEVVTAISKIRMFGFDKVYEGSDNRQKLQQEIGDVIAVVIVLSRYFPEVVNDTVLDAAVSRKITKLKKYFPFLKDFNLEEALEEDDKEAA